MNLRTSLFHSIAWAAAGSMMVIGAANAQGLSSEYPIDEETTNSALSQRGYSPYAGRNFPTQVFWGDQHVHTG